jgi:hypothetical protein
MKNLTINGVPYSVSGEAVYIYGTTTQIGSYKAETLTLMDDWIDKGKEILASYRTSLKTNTTAALAKAAELQKA